MAFDIAALQAMYGATRSHHRDDSYVLPARNETGTGYLCLWDTGGEDTIRAGRTDRACTIDLNAATLAYEPGGGGFLSSARGVRGGFTIANGVEIENAAGGDGDDRLVGNELANRLAGGAGADSFRGRAGADRLSAGDDDDRDVFLYRSARDSGPTVAEADRIGGFDPRNGPREGTWDRLDLAGLDADPDARGDQDAALRAGLLRARWRRAARPGARPAPGRRHPPARRPRRRQGRRHAADPPRHPAHHRPGLPPLTARTAPPADHARLAPSRRLVGLATFREGARMRAPFTRGRGD